MKQVTDCRSANVLIDYLLGVVGGEGGRAVGDRVLDLNQLRVRPLAERVSLTTGDQILINPTT